MEKVNVNLENLPKGVVVVEVREGKALEQSNPLQVNLNGSISSVKEFIGKNYPKDAPEGHVFEGVITIDKDEALISFVDKPHEAFGKTLVTARLIPNRRLALFGVNGERWFDQKSIAKLIRNNAVLFKTPEIVRTLLKQLDEMNLVVENSLTDNTDRRGNVETAYKRVIKDKKGLLPEFIELHTPLFEEQDPIDLKLEIEVDVQGNRPVYSFYCLEMDVLVEAERDKAFSKNITSYMMEHFTVITQ